MGDGQGNLAKQNIRPTIFRTGNMLSSVLPSSLALLDCESYLHANAHKYEDHAQQG
jgi:hypothetical protein